MMQQQQPTNANTLKEIANKIQTISELMHDMADSIVRYLSSIEREHADSSSAARDHLSDDSAVFPAAVDSTGEKVFEIASSEPIKKKEPRPPSAFSLYYTEKKREQRLLHPEMSGTDIYKRLLESWKTADKSAYQQQADSARKEKEEQRQATDASSVSPVEKKKRAKKPKLSSPSEPMPVEQMKQETPSVLASYIIAKDASAVAEAMSSSVEPSLSIPSLPEEKPKISEDKQEKKKRKKEKKEKSISTASPDCHSALPSITAFNEENNVPTMDKIKKKSKKEKKEKKENDSENVINANAV